MLGLPGGHERGPGLPEAPEEARQAYGADFVDQFLAATEKFVLSDMQDPIRVIEVRCRCCPARVHATPPRAADQNPACVRGCARRQALETALFHPNPDVRYKVGAPLSVRLFPGLVRTGAGDWLLRQLFKFPAVPAARL